MFRVKLLLFAAFFAIITNTGLIWAGPYSGPKATDLSLANVPDPGVPFPADPNAPGIYAGWATAVKNYSPTGTIAAQWKNPQKALGPAKADNFDICSLGDMPLADIVAGKKPGTITLFFDKAIIDRPGPDLAVFENGMTANGPNGQLFIFAELAYVEVSTDGVNFARFPSVSLNDPNIAIGAYMSLDPTNIYNLAGKHTNTGGQGWGTPFDLKDIANCPEVIGGKVNPGNIRFVRIVDIPGTGHFSDNAVALPDPRTRDPQTGFCHNYQNNNGIRDPWQTWGSGGFDLEAIGALNLINGDSNMDGIVDAADLDIMLNNWLRYTTWHYGDFDQNGIVNIKDLAIILNNWLK
ncbi:MAG: hypothetical protein JXM68_04700 [Sedimentisphaerales bacterium]|nr:hypothetical protein [Sedimentisphaerales bacterium]